MNSQRRRNQCICIVRFVRLVASVSTFISLILILLILITTNGTEAIQSVRDEHGGLDKTTSGKKLPQIFEEKNKADSLAGVPLTDTLEYTDSSCDLLYIIVSTIDGKVSALDLHKEGALVWSIEADSRPLYSSSLANMEMTQNGKKMRLIPSLDGALYQFDGEKVEAIPMSAETLLSSTYKLSDDSMIVGSKDLRNFGIDLMSGEVLFTCGTEGCNSNEEKMKKNPHIDKTVIVLTRTTQVVRSVDIKNGNEKWNFSVGQHQVNVSPNKARYNNIEKDEEAKQEEMDIPLFTARHYEECITHGTPEDDLFENYLRLVVPEGRVVALNKGDVSSIKWEYKFSSPIAKAWIVRNGTIEPMSLFDGRHIPTLGTFQPEDLENESNHQPLLYIGSHQKLLYIQPSPKMESVLNSFSRQKTGHVIEISWRPYLNTASFRTPIFGGNRPEVSSIKEKRTTESQGKETSLSVWHEDYPFDTGYFLYPEFQDKRSPKRDCLTLIEGLEEEEWILDTLPASLWMYWKEVIGISLTVSIVVHIFLNKFLHPERQSQNDNSSITRQSSENSKNNSNNQTLIVSLDSTPILEDCAEKSDGYVSRFATDFVCLHCLGKGGFGVVFEAVNKVDYMHYAVKRTMLPKSEGAKEKVLREVRALAKLEHIGIVRYFNAWVEFPPAGWQENVDKQYPLSLDLSGPISFSNTQSYSPSPEASVPRRIRYLHNDKQGKHEVAPPDVEEEASLGTTDSIVFGFSDSVDTPSVKRGSGSGEFSVHSNITDGSGSASDENDSLESEHRQTEMCSFHCGSSSKHSKADSARSFPFLNYTSNSSSFPHVKRHNLSYLQQTSGSIVFEGTNSGVDHNKEQNSKCYSSVIFQHSGGDSGTGTENGETSSEANKNHAIDITLSSYDGDNVEKEENEESNVSKEGMKFFLYIQMQLYRKDTLKDWLSNNTLNRDRQTILDIFDQIVCAVEYVHKCGLMHRDLKPSNIFFSADGIVKVGDFGLVTALPVQQDQEGQSNKSNSSDRHTAEVGTTLYMSPEQIARKPYDLKVDIFSLGLIFLELWIPFYTQMERIRTLQDAKKQKFPDNFTRELPAECELVGRMTSENASKRPVTEEILDHPLLKDLAPTRMSSFRRPRTISDKSIN